MKGWLAYGDGRFGEALSYYAMAIKADKRNEPLRVDRARVLYQTGQIDSALAELKLAVEDMRKRDKKDLIYVYQSKALAEHSIAVLNQRLGLTDAAREAFGQALQEDLSYYPAHMQLAFMSLDAKDTTAALSELELAVQLRGDDAVARFFYGFTLAATGKTAEAEAELRKSVALNSEYAAPRFALAEVLERLGRKADALVEYQNFIARAAKTDGRVKSAEDRSAVLKSSSGFHQ
jgi:tetratricopeptide (TPR) repeat protein